MNIFAKNALDLIGNTPLVEIESPNKNVRILVKLEKFNPSGSVKDRIIKEILESSENKRLLTKDKILLESTSGNTGISLAMIGKLKGYEVNIVMPESMSIERRKMIRVYDAKLILVPGTIDDAANKARELAKNPKYFYINQYANGYNILAHYKTTGPEIWKQTSGQITHFIAGIGTGGTIMGIGKYLKEKDPNIKIIGVEPHKNTPIQGLKNLEIQIKPDILDLTKIDEKTIVTLEQTIRIQKDMTTKGLFLGLSSGAVIYAALEKAKKIKHGLIVVLSADGGEKYLSITHDN
ncbi:MAG: cysteine synthase family protein [Nanoarchaeota archaeon]|nr:cysteine synthase family protein [Nanoarchaeota archaeon]MBU4072452.1 cysteine synthase family protein [Candidatus Thermoplasmatota archaeon]MBU4124423.1 cysteine synthase family protein [Nanoarchaeota archaeon]